MKTHALRLLAISVTALVSFSAVAQDVLPYKEGPVVQVTAVRTQPGKFNEYMNYILSGAYGKIMSEAKKQGLVSSYAVYAAQPRSPHDPDLYLVETYPNMAAFDGLGEKMNKLSNQVFGSIRQADQAQGERGSLRTIIGTELIRQLQPRD